LFASLLPEGALLREAVHASDLGVTIVNEEGKIAMWARVLICMGCAACLVFSSAAQPPAIQPPADVPEISIDSADLSPSSGSTFQAPPALKVPSPPSLILAPLREELDAEQDAEQRIRRTLGREGEQKEKEIESDPVLQDVLDIIRKKGSILDGSVVDEVVRGESQPSLTELQKRNNQVLSIAVEDLLRTARELESMAGGKVPAATIHTLRQLANEILSQLVDQ
jgi:hypothetical protein